MPRKPRVTRTINPLQFEALEPHRFEDLVRRLLYGFRDWSDLDPIGRAGSDDGFDVRAWERVRGARNINESGEEGEATAETRLWQIQCKRERDLPPSRVRKIIGEEVDGDAPPHGYVLAVAASVSKAAYDAFREALGKKGVREMHLWSREFLEDQLARPENDEILFTFFGISLSPRRRSITAGIKFALNNKNKCLRLLFGSDAALTDGIGGHHPILLRELSDEAYPDDDAYEDFSKRPRWKQYLVAQVDANGLWFRSGDFYAYADDETKEWDYSVAVDLSYMPGNTVRARHVEGRTLRENAEYFWRHLPRRTQARYLAFGYVAFADMLIIDEKGDPIHPVPQIFVDLDEENGPFTRVHRQLASSAETPIPFRELAKTWKRSPNFPATFVRQPRGELHEAEGLGIDLALTRNLRWEPVLYGFDDKCGMLKEGSIVVIAESSGGRSGEAEKNHYEITNISETTVREWKTRHPDPASVSGLAKWAGRELEDDEAFRVYEVARVYLWGDEGRHYSEDNRF